VPALAKPARAAQPAASSVSRAVGNALWEYQIEIAPVFRSGGTFSGPVGRVVQMIGDLRRPVATDKTVVDIALDRLAKPGRAAGRVNFPTGREHQRAPPSERGGAAGWTAGPVVKNRIQSYRDGRVRAQNHVPK